MALTKVLTGPTFPSDSPLRELQERAFDLPNAVVVRDKAGPALFRLPMQQGGFMDIWLRGEQQYEVAAIGTGRGNTAIMRAHFPDRIGLQTDEVPLGVSSPSAESEFLSWKTPLDVVDPIRMEEPDWRCRDVHWRQQTPYWCVPTCMSMLAERICGAPCDCPPELFARLWGQPPGIDLDLGTMYTEFRHVCTRLGLTPLKDYSGVEQPLTWGEVQAARSAILIAFAGGHAEVCAGCCTVTRKISGKTSRGFELYDPDSLGTAWMAFPKQDPLLVNFALRAPGTPCPAHL